MTQSDDNLIIRRGDLASAVSAGILDQATADRLVAHVSRADLADTGHADEESFRLITGFNDIFVCLGIGLLLGGLIYVSKGFAPAIVAAVSWLLAEFFTRRKRMAMPSIMLLLTFGGGAFFLGTLLGEHFFSGERGDTMGLLAGGVLAAVATFLHWLRFHVPITVAAGAAALAIILVAIITAAVPNAVQAYPIPVLLPIGLACFAAAMWFDMKDRARRTRWSDIAFWLHLLAAPLIIHPLVNGLFNVDSMGMGGAAGFFALFAVVAVVALVVDRRAILVSSLLYLGYAFYSLFERVGFAGQTSGLAFLIVGAVVLLLSAAWQPLRRQVLPFTPEAIRSRVPLAFIHPHHSKTGRP
jgi:MFS family permease